jgi:nucleotide-binding universal stress UspA family protein
MAKSTSRAQRPQRKTTQRSRALPQNILVAVDAGKLSDHAIEAALELAQEFGADLDLVHAFGTPGMFWQPTPDPREISKGTDPLTRATEAVTAHVAGVLGAQHGGRKRAEQLVRVIPGRPAEVILERARKQKSDLIVLGALRREPSVDFGGTARAILSGAPCPVWVQPGPVKELGRILVPVDLSQESFVALSTACEMARTFGSKVIALHVFDTPRVSAVPWTGYGGVIDIGLIRRTTAEGFDEAMAKFDWKGVEHEERFVEGSPSEEIRDYAKRADMIVMGTHGRTGFSALLLGSVAYDVLKHTKRPVMVVRKKGRKFAT